MQLIYSIGVLLALAAVLVLMYVVIDAAVRLYPYPAFEFYATTPEAQEAYIKTYKRRLRVCGPACLIVALLLAAVLIAGVHYGVLDMEAFRIRPEE